jgi:hypothetical protein
VENAKEERTSFCEQKEAKKLYQFGSGWLHHRAKRRKKVFWFFFSKKNFFLPFIPYPIALCGDRMAV